MENDNIPVGEITGESDSVSPVSAGLNEKVQKLVSLSKKKGYVTVQDINELIPDSANDPELIENIMNILDDLEIKLLDEDEVEIYREKTDQQRQITESVAMSGATLAGPYDPFDVYLEQVNLKPRISRAEELELFRHITDGEHRAQEFLFSRWLTLPLHLDIAHTDVRHPKLRVSHPYPLFRMHASKTKHNLYQTLDGTLCLQFLQANTIFLFFLNLSWPLSKNPKALNAPYHI
jgi:hypothetical protein